MNRTIFQSIASNNKRAIFIHVVMCIIVFLPILSIWKIDVWWNTMSRSDIIDNWIIIVIFSLIVFFIYFWLGRRFLVNTENILANLFSVASVPIIVALILILVVLDFEETMSLLVLLTFPVYPLSETVLFYCHIEKQYSHMIMSLLSPLAMWLGIVSKGVRR